MSVQLKKPKATKETNVLQVIPEKNKPLHFNTAFKRAQSGNSNVCCSAIAILELLCSFSCAGGKQVIVFYSCLKNFKTNETKEQTVSGEPLIIKNLEGFKNQPITVTVT